MLFIDSSGGNTARNNADLMVKRDRYPGLPLPEAAMALFTLQSQAPSGGAGNRTSMRGGGPLITLVEPSGQSEAPLWDMVWANVPYGAPLDPGGFKDALPWMRPTATSEKGQAVQPPESDRVPAETFFGMPRRLRLDFSADEPPRVTGVRQRPYGTNYGLWRHPLSPYYQQKAGSEHLPMHPRAGANSYRNWEGIAFERSDGLRHIAECVRTWSHRGHDAFTLHVGGWAMDNMKPRDFVWSKQPLFPLDEEAEDAAISLIEAANAFSLALAGAMQTLTGAGDMGATVVETVREAFFTETQDDFETMLSRLSNGTALADIADAWCKVLRDVAMPLFEKRALPGLASRGIEDAEAIVKAHGQLRAAFRGYGNKTGTQAYKALGLELPKPRKPKEKAA
jgi:CRISPR system Cascade subunit CasA